MILLRVWVKLLGQFMILRFQLRLRHKFRQIHELEVQSSLRSQAHRPERALLLSTIGLRIRVCLFLVRICFLPPLSDLFFELVKVELLRERTCCGHNCSFHHF